MEKSGMDRGRTLNRPGLLKRALPELQLLAASLLSLAGLLLPAPRLEAQSPPRLETESFPQSPLAGEYWALRFLVDHPLPREVEVELPPLPPLLSLDRIRVEARLTEGPGGETRRQTVLEYYFFLNASGQVSLPPFDLSVPAPEDPADPEAGKGGETARRIRFRSPALRFFVRAPGGAGQPDAGRRPRISWKDSPALLRPGEEAEFSLVCRNWDPRLPLPSPRLLIPRTPVGAILEMAPPREGDEAAGVLLRLRLIPLEEGRLNIPGFTVPAGDYSLDIPALTIPVGPPALQDHPAAPPAAPALAAADPADSGPSPGEAPPASRLLPFPANSPEPLPPFREGCGSIRDRARALWDRGFRAEALAELRRNERDYAGGPALIPLRREAERLLGLSGNGDEIWRPRFLLKGTLVISALLAGASLFLVLSRKRGVTPGPAWCYRIIGYLRRKKAVSGSVFLKVSAVFFACLALFSLRSLGFFPFTGLSLPGASGPPRAALARETEAFRVPDPAGTPAFRLEEGRRLLVRSVQGDWAYAEPLGREEGGKAGWVKLEALVFY